MMYKSPIEILHKQRTEVDNMIYRAILDVGVVVDKDELLKALEYDRGQYEKGYSDALARDDVVEVVRCKDCVWHNEENKCVNSHCTKSYYGCRVRDMHFCSYGERRTE